MAPRVPFHRNVALVENRLLAVSIAVSVALGAAFAFVYAGAGGELALAQGVDSVADVLTGAALLFALVVSRRPADDDHHFGHQPAQPVAALIVAVLVGILAVEVLRSAVEALLRGDAVVIGWALGGVLAVKTAVKVVFVAIVRFGDRRDSSVMRAFATDATNDALLGALSLVGLIVSRWGRFEQLDAWLALPVGLWIFGSGVMLGLESVRLLMGAAPPEARQAALQRILEATPGVAGVGDLRVRYTGNELDVWAEIFVDASLPIGRAHDIGESAEARLMQEPDVVRVVVHVDAT